LARFLSRQIKHEELATSTPNSPSIVKEETASHSSERESLRRTPERFVLRLAEVANESVTPQPKAPIAFRDGESRKTPFPAGSFCWYFVALDQFA
jgi:hypothetical protein